MNRLLQASAFLTLLGLALMVWSMIEPTPMPVMLAMSVGQVFGTVAFGMFGYAVLVDQLRKQHAKAAAAALAAAGIVPPASPPAAPKTTDGAAQTSTPEAPSAPTREAPP